MSDSQFVVLLDGSSYKPMYEHMLLDLSNMPDVTFVTDLQHTNKIKNLLLKRKVQFLSKGKLDFLAYEQNNLFETLKYYCSKKKNVYVIFLNAALYYNPYLPGTLKKYKELLKNLKYILFYLDIIDVPVSRNADLLRKKDVFDLVYTIDKSNAEKGELILWSTFYSKNENYLNIPQENDIYFCGVSKGRASILVECARLADNYKVDVAMDVICYDDADIFGSGVKGVTVRNPNEYLSYPEVIKNELKSNCILEIVQTGQVALTLRPYEAVVYNKKLLTNNKSIFNFEFYDERFMRYFERMEDIDWNWIKERDVNIDYGYKDEFSPMKLLKDILNRNNN